MTQVVEPGDLLVVTTTSASTDGMLGELLATPCGSVVHGIDHPRRRSRLARPARHGSRCRVAVCMRKGQ